MNKIIRILVGVVGTIMLAGCASSTDPSDAYKGETPEHIYQKGKEALKDKSYGEAIKRFEALDIQYPFTPETEQAQLYLVYAYYMKEEYLMSASAADRFIRLHPANPHIDYVYYMHGLADFYQNMGVLERIFAVDLATRDLTQIQKSYISFYDVVTRYPNSRYAPSSYQYLVYLRNMMADHELQTAKYYYSRKAYIAAVERASNVVTHFQGAPATKSSLVLMVDAYHELGENKLAEDAQKVIDYNYRQ